MPCWSVQVRKTNVIFGEVVCFHSYSYTHVCTCTCMEGIGHTAHLAGVVTGHGIVLLKVPFKIQVNSSTKY